jgi:hypothetical protein
MPRYVIRIPVETMRDEDSLLFPYDNIPKHIDVNVMASTPVDAMKFLAQTLSTLLNEVQKGKILKLE